MNDVVGIKGFIWNGVTKMDQGGIWASLLNVLFCKQEDGNLFLGEGGFFMLKKSFAIMLFIIAVVLLATSPTFASNNVTVTRLAGSNRTATAVEISKQGWPTGSSVVVLARDDNFPDALAGTPLAYKFNAPILLTNSQTLSTETEAEIERINPTKIFILGSPKAISNEIEQKLKLKYAVERVGGSDRFETAAKIASAVGGSSGKAVIAYGFNFPDALAVSSWAANKNIPILLTDKDTIPIPTQESLKDLGIKQTIIVGSSAVISDNVCSKLPNPERYWGDNRYQTAVDIISRLGCNTDTLLVATGENFPDALAGSAFAARTNSAVLLIDPSLSEPKVKELLTSNAGKVSTVFFLGSSGVISQTEEDEIMQMLDPQDIPKIDNTQDQLIKVAANPEKGFNYPYYLWVPKYINNSEQRYLLIEPNNSGIVSDDLALHDALAKELAEKLNGHYIAESLRIPFLVPVFPRPQTDWQLYTHELNRATLLVQNGDMKRLDLQLVAMVRDAQNLLSYNGIAMKDKIFMNGFSASAKFVNRFAILHPNIVRAVATGGINGIPTFPTDSVDGNVVRYPVGIADIREITGLYLDLAQYKTISQYIYMGENDTNDDTWFADAYEQQDADLIHRIIGLKMMPDRWEKSQAIYNQLGIPAQFVTYRGIGHEVPGYVWDDLNSFFRANWGDRIVQITHHE